MTQVYLTGLPAELLPGSYDGIPFFLDRATVTGGRKDVKKEFPNTNRQLIEDLGKRPRIYNLELIVAADENGENYKQRRDQLIDRLDAGGRATLVHPTFGPIDNIVARTFTLVEDLTRLGDTRVTVLFELDDFDGTPSIAVTSPQDIAISADSVRGQAASEFPSRYSPASTANNYNAAVSKLRDVTQAFSDNVSFLAVSSDTIDQFTNQLAGFSDDILQLANSPQELADSVNNLFTSVSNLYSTPSQAFEVLKKFFTFGDDDVPVERNTASRIQRDRNRVALNGLMQAEALTLAYSAAATIEFNTVVEVDTVVDDLEVEYQDIVVTNSSDINTIFAETNGLSVEVLDSIAVLRSDVQDVFDTQKLSAKRIIGVRTNTIPSRVLAYQYYGESTEGENLAALNEDLNVSFISGDVEILTA